MNTGGRGKGREVKPETMAQQSAFLKKMHRRDHTRRSHHFQSRQNKNKGAGFSGGGSSPLQPSQRTFLKDNLFSFFVQFSFKRLTVYLQD